MPVIQDLFFPGGVSKKGTVEDFNFFMADATHTKVDENMKIRDLLEHTKLKQVRLYMVTYPISTSNDSLASIDASINQTDDNEIGSSESSREESTAKKGLDEISTNEKTSTSTVKQTECNVETQLEELESAEGYDASYINVSEWNVENCANGNKLDLGYIEASGNETNMVVETASQDSVSTNISEPGEIFIQGHGAQSLDHDNSVPVDHIIEQSTSVQQDENDYLEDFLRRSGELPSASDKPDIIRIHRSMVLNELIPIFKDPTIISRTLQYIFVNERGHDSQGLSRDVYSAFWDSFCLKYTDGEDFRVPVLSNELGDTEWEAVGRILLKGYYDLKYFPMSIAPAFFIAVCHGESAVSGEILKSSFLSYLSASEKEMLEHGLSGAEYDKEELIDLLDRFECHSVPNQENLLSLILQIAHRKLIQEPKYAMDALQRVGQSLWLAEFPSIDLILAMYEKLVPTVPKVLALFSANPISKEQNDSLKYLQKFVRGRSKEQLKHFLRFLTGSDMLCVKEIDITFVLRSGAGRVPTAHTCGPVLELPSTYVSYPDFRNEWDTLLKSEENMSMMIA